MACIGGTLRNDVFNEQTPANKEGIKGQKHLIKNNGMGKQNNVERGVNISKKWIEKEPDVDWRVLLQNDE